MSLKQKLQDDLTAALKAHEDLKRLVLGSVMSSLHNKEIEKRTAKAKEMPSASNEELEKASVLTDEEITKVIEKEIKKRRDAVEMYEKGNRPELAQKEKNEIDILVSYLNGTP